jgi:hypothetical protein
MSCTNNFSFTDPYQVKNHFSYYKNIYKKTLLIEKKGQNKFNSIIIFKDGKEIQCQLLKRISLSTESYNMPFRNDNYLINSRYVWDDLEIRIISEDLDFFTYNINQEKSFSLINFLENGTATERWNINGYLSTIGVYETDCFDLNLIINHATLHF